MSPLTGSMSDNISYNAVLPILGVVLFIFVISASALPSTLSASTAPLPSSADVWATVVTNVAPLMALIGERNAKEHLRTTSYWQQLLPMATAPLGILSILVSAIRLSGARLLQRLVGRESDRQGEALVELTPLSVAPATSAFTHRAVEIEPVTSKERVAFVCGHVPDTSFSQAITAFQMIYSHRDADAAEDRDFELALALRGSTMSVEEVAAIVVQSCYAGKPELSKDSENKAEAIAIRANTVAKYANKSGASLSYRTAGISPSQTPGLSRAGKWSTAQLLQVIAAMVLLFLVIVIQVTAIYSGTGAVDLQTLLMGIIGYIGVVISTLCLLQSIKEEIQLDAEELAPMFEDATWTFSDARHTELRPFPRPPQNALVTALPRHFSPAQRTRRHIWTSGLCATLVGSYIIFYLGIRVAEWWVALGILLITWVSAAFRAVSVQNYLVASQISHGEEWLGRFKDTLSESLVATVDAMEGGNILTGRNQLVQSPEQKLNDSIDQQPSQNASKDVGNCVRVVANAYRTSLHTWSSAEDIMKIGLEIAKKACTSRVVNIPHATINSSMPRPTLRWTVVVRFHLQIYVPGLLWRAIPSLDFALTENFDLPHLYRDMFKMLQTCKDQVGTICRRDLDEKDTEGLEQLYGSPISSLDTIPLGESVTLGRLLSYIRDLTPGNEKSSLEQAIVLPTAMLATIYDRWRPASTGIEPGANIDRLQSAHTDKLALGGAAYLKFLEAIWEREHVWDGSMVTRATTPAAETTSARGPQKDNYKLFNKVNGVQVRTEISEPGVAGKQTSGHTKVT